MSSVLTTDLTGHLALITGATGAILNPGIGKATAIALAALGCSVAVHYNAAASSAESLVTQLEAPVQGVKARAFQADLGDYDEVRRLYKEVVESMGHPTILFNNAGASLGKSGVQEIGEVSIEDFEKTWRTNCGSTYLLTQLCVPAMEEAGWGRVIFCSSVAGFTGGSIGPHYASSKSAMHGLVHWLAGKYAKKGITVNGVAPALIEETKLLPGGSEEMGKRIPIGRCGKPEEIAETVVFMVKNAYVTNKVFAIDGGMFIQ